MSRRKIVDLARERRIRTNLAKLKEMLAGNPELARRTHDALTGKLAAPRSGGSNGRTTSRFRFECRGVFLKRVEKLARQIRKDPAHSTTYRVTRASTLRMALLRGVEALEAEQATK